jgi:hypothetical protein
MRSPLRRTLPSLHIAHTQIAADLAHAGGKLELRAMTNSSEKRDSSVMMSSTMPSTRYSCSGRELRLAKGQHRNGGFIRKGKQRFCLGRRDRRLD